MTGAVPSDLAVLESWFDALLTTSTAVGVISGFENRFVRANAAMAELLGVSLEELWQADPYVLAHRTAHPDDITREQALFAELATGQRRSYELEKRYVLPDGSYRWGRLTFTAIFAEVDGSAVPPIRFAVLHVVDITEQRALAEALARREQELRHAQKVDAIGRLAAGVAHDFNNLLTVVVGHGSVAKDRLLEHGETPWAAECIEDLDAILDASGRASSLTAQLLAYGRREAQNPRVLSLSSAVEPLRRLLARTIGSNIVVEESLSAQGAIFADPGYVAQVVMNLMLNARDAMPDGGRVTLATRDVSAESAGAEDTPGPGEWVALSVTDTGHGMTPEVQARMFEPFFTTRGDRPGTQGNGLGLATVQRVIDELGGHIRVVTTPGAGTRVTVYFPRTTNDLGAARPGEPARAEEARAGQRILVVEDDPRVRALVASVLLGAKYRVRVARDGEDALGILNGEAGSFDLVLTDLMLPGVGGKKLAGVLEARRSPPRVLFISGYADVTPKELAPYGELLAKPFTPAELLAAVSRALESGVRGAPV